jgi:FixJ family two-component response regulator
MDELAVLAPHCSIVVAAPEVHADQWEQVIFAGAFDLILFPFNRTELAGVLHGAYAFATEHLSDEARNGRVRDILAAVERQTRRGDCQETRPFRTA